MVIVSNNIGNSHAKTLNVLPLTKHIKKQGLPCHTELYPAALSDEHQSFDVSMILAEQITTIDKSQLRNYAGRIGDARVMDSINISISGQLGLNPEKNHTAGTLGKNATEEDVNG